MKNKVHYIWNINDIYIYKLVVILFIEHIYSLYN